MKHKLMAGCGVLIGLLCMASQAAEKEPMGTITFMIGDVDIQQAGGTEWTEAELDSCAYEKDKIRTREESRCEVTLMDQKIIRIGEKALFELMREPNGKEKVGIKSGKVWMNIRSLVGKKQLRVQTPTAVAAIRGTVYRLSCDANSSSYWVYEGRIAVTPTKADGEGLEDSTFCVNAGDEFTVVKDFEEYKRQQREALKKFKRREKEEFQEFMRRQKQALEEFKRKEKEEFQQFKSLHYALTKFDKEEDQKLEWVQWNLERDKQLGK